MKQDQDFAELVEMTRVPLADLVAKVLAANGDQAIIERWIEVAAQGFARAWWDGLHSARDHAFESGVTSERFKRLRPDGVPQ